MKASLLLNIKQSRAKSPVTNLVGGGQITTYVDSLEQIPQGKMQYVLRCSARCSAQGGANQVVIALAAESLRNVAPIDPFLTSGSTGPDLNPNLTPIGSSAAEIATLNQGHPYVMHNPFIVPYGFFIKAIMVGGSASATGEQIFLDYVWAYIDPKCEIDL